MDQHVCEWRSGFASAALSIVNAFFNDNEYNSDNDHQNFAKATLESYAFHYHDVSTAKDGEVRIPSSKGNSSYLFIFRQNARVFLAGHSSFKPLQPTSLQSRAPYMYQILES